MSTKKLSYAASLLGIATILLGTSTAHAQDKTYETLTSGTGSFKPGFTINPSLQFSPVAGSSILSANFAAGIVLKDKFTIGGFYNASANNFRPDNLNVPNTYADIRYGGLHLEYTANAHKAFHLSFPLQLGFGEIELDREDSGANFGEEKFFVIKPGILGEVNIHPNIRFQAGVSYRLATEFTYQNLTASDISGLNFNAGLRVGIFHWNKGKK